MYPSVGLRQDLDDPDVCSLLNSNFWIQLFALFAVLRVLWIVLALRTSPLDDEEDDNEKNDHCEKDPDHDRHQKSIWIPRRWVDFALERKQVFIKMYFWKFLRIFSAQCLLTVIDAPVECLLISHSLLIKMNWKALM